MIYKIESCGIIEYYQAKDILHLVSEYQKEVGGQIEKIESIDEKEAKGIMIDLTNEDRLELGLGKDVLKLSLYDLSDGDEFLVLLSTEY